MNLRVRLSLFIHLSLYLWHTIKMDSIEIENNLRQIITVLRCVVSRICIFGIRIVSFFSQICKSILYYILYLYKYNISIIYYAIIYVYLTMYTFMQL